MNGNTTHILYALFTHLLCTFQSLPTFIHLIRENPTSAAFSFLTMYSIRHRTLTEHPKYFNDLFYRFSDSDRVSHDIGKLATPSQYPLQLIKSHRRQIPIKSTHRNEVTHPFHLEPIARRVG